MLAPARPVLEAGGRPSSSSSPLAAFPTFGAFADAAYADPAAAPLLARALADGLGVTTGELRKLAQQGALTSEVVIKALQGQASTLRTEFDKLPPTVGRALQNQIGRAHV